MWYRRFVSWLRSLFTTSEVNAQPAPFESETPTLPMTAPLREPFETRDESVALPQPTVEFPELPSYREPPTTVPLTRLARPSQPLTGGPMGVDGMGMGRLGWVSREPPQPSQPTQPTQPLAETPRPIEPAWLDADEPEDASASMDGGDREISAIEPDSDLFLRLTLLRRLVRQRVYNEGFAPDAMPEQYRRYPDQDDFDSPFSAQ